MSSTEKYYDHELMADYFFQQHQIATELMLGLTNDDTRKIASKWLHFLYDADTISRETSAKLLIVQGLILMLNANILVAPLNVPPTTDTDVTELSKCNFIHLINSELNKYRVPKIPPKVQYEVSHDKKEYTAYQKIPGYGSHFCYVYSNDPIVKTEPESGVPILDETISLEKKPHPLIQKYMKEIQSCIPSQQDIDEFRYNEITESFGGMKIPSVDPDDDVEKEYELLNSDGAIGNQNSVILSDLDVSDDQYDQFAQDPLHHDRSRLGLKENILEKEHEQRVLLEERIKNRSIVIPQTSTPRGKYKRTVSTRVKASHLEPISAPVTPSLKDTSVVPNARRDLIEAMYDLEQELDNTNISSSDSSIPSAIKHKINKVWDNPLMHDLSSSRHQVTLPPPPKINFQSTLMDKHQSY